VQLLFSAAGAQSILSRLMQLSRSVAGQSRLSFAATGRLPSLPARLRCKQVRVQRTDHALTTSRCEAAVQLPKGSGQHPLELLLGPLELEVEQCHRPEERKHDLSGKSFNRLTSKGGRGAEAGAQKWCFEQVLTRFMT
jgi:hypothetical protein